MGDILGGSLFPNGPIRLLAALATAGVVAVLGPTQGSGSPSTGAAPAVAVAPAHGPLVGVALAPAPLVAVLPAGPTLPAPAKQGGAVTGPGSGAARGLTPLRRKVSGVRPTATQARALERASLDYFHHLATARSGLISARSTAPPPPLG